MVIGTAAARSRVKRRGYSGMVVGLMLQAALFVHSAGAATSASLIGEADRLVKDEDRFPASSRQATALYQQAARLQEHTAELHLKLANTALALGDGLPAEALDWYALGADAAERALTLAPNSADAHFLVAATRGQVARRQLTTARPWTVRELEKHLEQALALDPRHVRALHMMGVLLRDTPLPLRVFLTGKKDQVEQYLTRAVQAGPNFAAGRLDLARYYVGTGRTTEARRHAEAVVALPPPHQTRRWREEFRPAAEELLKQLPPARGSAGPQRIVQR